MYYLYNIRKQLLLVTPSTESLREKISNVLGYDVSKEEIHKPFGNLVVLSFFIMKEHKFKSNEWGLLMKSKTKYTENLLSIIKSKYVVDTTTGIINVPCSKEKEARKDKDLMELVRTSNFTAQLTIE